MAPPILSFGADPMLDEVAVDLPRLLESRLLIQALGVSATTGTFRNNLSTLRTRGLIADVSRTDIAATDLLFPKGLR